MKKIDLKNLSFKKLTIVFVVTVFFSLCGFGLVYMGKHNYTNQVVTYDEQNNIDYKVYLKPNNFFTESYLPKNKTYIATLIDYVDIDFENNLEMSEVVSGSYTYYVKATMTANKQNTNAEYLKRDYTLSDKKEVSYQDKDALNIKENIKIDYDTYNNMLLSFKNEFGLAMDGNLKVELIVENTVHNSYEDRDVLKESSLELNIPLTSQVIEVPINYKTQNNQGTLIAARILHDSNLSMLSRGCGAICFVLSALGTVVLIYAAMVSIKNESIYKKRLRNILKTYDGIIVNVKNLPIIYDQNRVEVVNFEELIDAHSEIRNPINFVETLDGATFVLDNKKVVYTYVLKRDLLKVDQSGYHDEK